MKKFCFFIIIFFGCISCVYAKVKTDRYMWLKDTNLIVTDDIREEYISNFGLKGLTNGTVLLNYSVQYQSLTAEPKDLSLSTAQVGLALITAYKATDDFEYLDRAILVGNNTIENKIFQAEYAHSSTSVGEMLTMIAPNMSMKNGSWNYDFVGRYSYPLDSLMNCEFLIELSNVTGDSKYVDVALDVIDSWIFVQSKFSGVDARNGGLPYYIYYADKSVLSWGEGMWPSWEAPLDLAYSVYLAGMGAYEYTNDVKYKDFVDNYYSFLYRALETYNGTFTFKKDGNNYMLPYEYLVSIDSVYTGINKSNQDFTNSKTNDITIDQLYYIVLGMAHYDKDNFYLKEFVKSIKKIALEDGTFWGEYTVTGDIGSSIDTRIETIDSAFFLRLLRIIEDSIDTDYIKKSLMTYQMKSDNVNVNGAWTWNLKSEYNTIESLATALSLQEINYGLDDFSGITLGDQFNNLEMDSTVNKTDNIVNPETSNSSVAHRALIIFVFFVLIVIILMVVCKKKVYKI